MTRRIMATVITACLLGLLVQVVPTALAIRAKNQHQDQLEMQQRAATAARTFVRGSPFPPTDDPDHRYAVYRPDGVRDLGDGPASADQVVFDAAKSGSAAGQTSSEVVAAAVVGAGDRATWVVRVAEPMAESIRSTTVEIAGLFLLALLALCASALAGWLLVRRLLRPLTELRRTAEQMGSGAVVTTVPETGMPELDEIGQTLAGSHRRMLEVLTRERAFASDVSHQLRTPLTAVITALEAEQLHPRPDTTAILTESLAGLRRLQLTVEQLLELARDVPPARQASVAADLVRDTYRVWQPIFSAAGRRLRLELRPAPQVHVARAAIGQILDVLVDNALRHGRGSTTLSVGPAPGGVVLSVTDEGPGPRHRDTLFARRDPQAAGTGIGLALARELAEINGARLRLASVGPTRFELLLPQQALSGQPAEQAPDPGRKTPATTAD